MLGHVLQAAMSLLVVIRDYIYNQEDKETVTSCIDLLSQYSPEPDKEG